MTSSKRFLIGGGGALMPVLVSILAVDIATIVDNESGLTTGNVVGFVIRYIILFVVGGIVAWLHEDEKKPFKLFELGIAAPALITSLVTAQGVVARGGDLVPVENTFHGPGIVSEAYAATGAPASEHLVVAGLIDDVWSGISGRAYKQANTRKASDVDAKQVAEDKQQAAEDKQQAAEDKQQAEVETRELRRELEVEKTRSRGDRERVEQLESEAAAARARVEMLERQLEAARSDRTE